MGPSTVLETARYVCVSTAETIVAPENRDGWLPTAAALVYSASVCFVVCERWYHSQGHCFCWCNTTTIGTIPSFPRRRRRRRSVISSIGLLCHLERDRPSNRAKKCVWGGGRDKDWLAAIFLDDSLTLICLWVGVANGICTCRWSGLLQNICPSHVKVSTNIQDNL